MALDKMLLDETYHNKIQATGLTEQELCQVLDSLDKKDSKISEDLLSRDELLFKRILLQKIKKQGNSYRLWYLLNSNGSTHPEILKIDPESYVSYTGNYDGSITLGGKKIPPLMANKMIYFDSAFDYEKEMIWKLNHEMSHFVSETLLQQSAEFKKFYDTYILSPREVSGKGLTLLGSLETYQQRGGPEEQAVEDVTEMINMFILDPTYLFDSLSLLKTMNENFLQRYNLKRLTDNEIIHIVECIEMFVDYFFSTYEC